MFLRIYIGLAFFIFFFKVQAQKKQEQEFGIKKEELPDNILPLLSDDLTNVKRLRFYKEIDGQKSSYEVKFKKNTLFYSVEFDENGQLEDVEFIVKENDIPKPTWSVLKNYLLSTYGKYRIKKIQQHYPNDDNQAAAVLKMAFENQLNSQIKYEVIIASKDQDGYHEYEITFDVAGKHVLTRKSIAPKYDHVLFNKIFGFSIMLLLWFRQRACSRKPDYLWSTSFSH